MAKKIAEKSQDIADAIKYVEIKHLRTMKNEEGKDVTVVDKVQEKPVDEAIAQAEKRLAVVEAEATELKADIAEYKKIKG
tara:strand:- start:547 stop:786 length:240 start_codon:yes stop_codon:yes gene_type:complete